MTPSDQAAPTILLVGTYDTKDDELAYVADVMRAQGGDVLTMDVSVLGDPSSPTDISKHDVARAGGHTIEEAIESGDENVAMQIMAKGSAITAARLHGEGKIRYKELRLTAEKIDSRLVPGKARCPESIS